MAKKGSASKEQAKLAKKEKQEQKAAKKLAKIDGGAEEGNIVDLVNALDTVPVVEGGSGEAPPPPRTSFTFIASKQGFVVFGGEYFDSKTCKVFNDAYKWNPGKDEPWKRGNGKGAPKPRVGHASCLFNDEIYILGGEFATNSQFYHFRDFWKLDPKSLTWTELTGVNGPSSRSGHRLTVCRNQLLAFGGFQDTGKDVRYHNDLFAYTPATASWKKVVVSKAPTPRSAAVVAANNDGMLLSGGFSKTKDTDRDCKGLFHDDMWWLDMRPTFAETPEAPVWTRLKKRALTRAGLAFCQHKNLVYAFGGVIDNDAGGNSYNSSFFFNDVWSIDLGSKQWTRLKIGGEETMSDNSAEAAAKTATNLGQPIVAYRPKKTLMERVVLDVDVLKHVECEMEAKKNNESSKAKKRAKQEAATKVDEADQRKIRDAGIVAKLDLLGYDQNPSLLKEPLPRANAGVAVKDGYLYLYGGSIEAGTSRNILFDDAWRLSLRTLSWECIAAGEYWTRAPKWDDADVEASSSGEDSDDDSDDDSETGTSPTLVDSDESMTESGSDEEDDCAGSDSSEDY